jgi:hypothetical protein
MTATTNRIDARKLADLLRGNQLKPVYHGETGVRMLLGTIPELSDHREKSVSGDASVKSAIPQLGRSLCGKRRLLHPASSGVAGENP